MRGNRGSIGERSWYMGLGVRRGQMSEAVLAFFCGMSLFCYFVKIVSFIYLKIIYFEIKQRQFDKWRKQVHSSGFKR